MRLSTGFTRILGRSGEILLLAVLLLVWWVEYPLSQDGPSHAYTAQLATNLILARGTPGIEYHELHFVPNLGATLLTGAICAAFEPRIALKVLLSLTLLCTFLSLRFFAHSIGIDTTGHSYVLFFLCNTWFAWMGFHGFCLAASLALAGAGYYVRRSRNWNVGDGILLLLLSVLVVFMHPFPAVFLSGMLLLLACQQFWAPSGNGQQVELAEGAPSNLAVGSCVLSAVVGLAALPLLRAAAPAGHQAPVLVPSLRDFVQAALFFPTDAFTVTRLPHADNYYFIAVQALVLVYVLIEGTRRHGAAILRSPLLLAGLALLLARMVLYDGVGGAGFTTARLSFFVWILLVLYAWSHCDSDRLKSAARLLGVCSLAGGVLMQGAVLWRVDAAVKDLLGVAQNAGMKPGQTLLRVRYPLPEFQRKYDLQRLRVDPLMSGQDWIALNTGVIDLTNYEVLGWQFPVQLRAQRFSASLKAQLNWLSEISESGHASRLAKILEEMRGNVDFVLVIGEQGADWNSTGGRRGLFESLSEEGFVLVSQRGSPVFARLFMRRG